MTFTRLNSFSKKPSDLPDVPSPSMTPDDIRSMWETPLDELLSTQSNLIDGLNANTGATNIGAKKQDGTTSNIQAEINTNAGNLNTHKQATTLDHPDKSVVESKLADDSVSRRTIQAGAVGTNEIDPSILAQPTTAIGQQAKFDSIDSQLAEITTNLVYIDAFPKQTGETNDSPRIARAIASLGTNAGKLIIGQPLVISQTIKINNPNIMIDGINANVGMISLDTSVTFNGESAVLFSPGSGFSFLDNCNIKNVTIDLKSNANVKGIIFEGAYDTSNMEHIRFANAVNRLIEVRKCASTGFISQGVTLRDIMTNAKGGLTSSAILVSNSNEIKLDGVKILGGDDLTTMSHVAGLELSGDARGVSVASNCAFAWLDTGVLIEDARENKVIGVTFEGLNYAVKLMGKSDGSYLTSLNDIKSNRIFNIQTQAIYVDYAQYNDIELKDETITLTNHSQSNTVKKAVFASNLTDLVNNGSYNVIFGRLLNEWHIVADFMKLKYLSIIYDESGRMVLAPVNNALDVLTNDKTSYLWRFNNNGIHQSYRNINMNGYYLQGAGYHGFSPIAATNAVNNSLYIDSADNKLKFKDSAGTITIIAT